MANMSLEAKAGQVLVASFNEPGVGEQARLLTEQVQVGGIIYFAWSNDLSCPQSVQALSRQLQDLSGIPLLLIVDQEGGPVSRLQGSSFDAFPSNAEVAAGGQIEQAEEVAYGIGEQLLSVGINMNFAPVVDVDRFAYSTMASARSFGSDPEQVVRFAGAALDGYRRSGVLATLKHFPGHGAAGVDSHEALPVAALPLETLQEVHLKPFEQLAPVADAIMTAHLLVPALDAEHCVTLSEKALTYLRCRLGFTGVIVSDSLVMQGVLAEAGTVEEAAIQALAAGCDLLLIGGGAPGLTGLEVAAVHRALIDAVREGRIAEKRLDEAVARVLALKAKQGICGSLAPL